MAKPLTFAISLMWHYHFRTPSDRQLIHFSVGKDCGLDFTDEADCFSSWWQSVNEYGFMTYSVMEYYANEADALTRLAELFPLTIEPFSRVPVGELRMLVATLSKRRFPKPRDIWDEPIFIEVP